MKKKKGRYVNQKKRRGATEKKEECARLLWGSQKVEITKKEKERKREGGLLEKD